MRDLRSVGPFCGEKYHKKGQLHYGAIQRRYERGSKINKMSHVLNLRHAVESLAALR